MVKMVKKGNDNGNWKFEPMDANPHQKDSCVVMYWAQTNMNPGEQRTMAFTYGLGTLFGTGSGRLALTGSGAFRPNGTFTVVAYVKNPDPGQTVTLRLPEGLTFAKDEVAQKVLESGKDVTQVSWRVKAEKVGDFALDAELAGVARARYNVRIRDRGILD